VPTLEREELLAELRAQVARRAEFGLFSSARFGHGCRHCLQAYANRLAITRKPSRADRSQAELMLCSWQEDLLVCAAGLGFRRSATTLANRCSHCSDVNPHQPRI
jgi:hypothetical protein